MFVLASLFETIFKRKGLGGADVNMLSVAAMFMNWSHALYMLGLACFTALIIFLIFRLTKQGKQQAEEEKHSVDGLYPKIITQGAIPFGPAIAIVFVLVLI